ncbi:uncharacterized protein APUU_60140A [Aspergillus puulaauensis]|uniref:Uncharacterized protein n=1 Tax=Aspergillus puulaauensis TaxID=1220207 RepID=A0A7R7XTH6_9EURO|nr:uncharacterized protein APUU_60140A [Aspergillus puulaauensis]BCS27092.1 hypothetical protein APUU_60140A [Aspergillus puulaauensis]
MLNLSPSNNGSGTRISYWADGHTIIALLEAGADPVTTVEGENILSLWLNGAHRASPSPERFDQVLIAIINRLPNINTKMDYYGFGVSEKTILHRLVEDQFSDPSYVRRVLRIFLDADINRPLNIDGLDSSGRTSLLALLDCINRWEPVQDNILETARAFIEAGARLDFVSASGDSALSSVIDAVNFSQSLEEGRITVSNIEKVLTLDPGAKLVDHLPVSVLAEALYRGHILIAAALLRHRMKDSINRVTGSSTWLEGDLFDDNPHALATVSQQLGKPTFISARVSGTHRHGAIGTHISDLAFCGMGRTRFYAWSRSLVTAYPMLPLAGVKQSCTGKNHWEDEEGKDTLFEWTWTEPQSARPAETDAPCEFANPLRDLDPLLTAMEKQRKFEPMVLNPGFDRRRDIGRSRTSSLRGHSCPGTERRWLSGLEAIKRPTVKYYAYTVQELQTTGWRRDSLPGLNTDITADLAFEKLQDYVFCSDGGGLPVGGSRVLERVDDDTESPDEWWLQGMPRHQGRGYYPLISRALDEKLDSLERWYAKPKDFDLDTGIAMAKQAIMSTTGGHPRREEWIENLREKFQLQDLQRHIDLPEGLDTWSQVDLRSIYELEKSINAHRYDAWSVSAGSPHRFRSLTCLVTHLEALYNHTGEMTFLDEAVSTARQALEDSLADDWDMLGLSDEVDRSLYRSNLAALLTLRYNRTAVSDLDQAIDMARQFVREVGAQDHFRANSVLRKLGINLERRYELTGHISFLNEAIEVAQQILEADRDEDVDEADALHDLLSRLWRRYRAAGSRSDCETAWQCATLFRHSMLREIKPPATGGSAKDSADCSTDDATGYLTEDSAELEGSSTESDESTSGSRK